MTQTNDGYIIDTPVEDEMRTSFLSYGMSVVVSRALPDVRDGLKPVHRRILFGMAEANLTPARQHVKCARVVGDVMGKYHPHGDGAIYDALVRLAQDFSMRLPLVDGHGNFGTHTDPPAAMRYTECRMAKPALAMTDELGEDTVDFKDNYDGTEREPKVLPAAFPNLLVNGTEGIAVGMATKIPPHNLVEVVNACKHLLAHPGATLDDVMAIITGPDLPTGGYVLGLEGVREAYRTGRGKFDMRARAEITDVSARRKGIVISELPYQVGPEAVIEAIKKQRDAKKLQGVSNVLDLSDMKSGLRLVIECKTGFNPHAVLEELYKTTPLQTSFHIHNLALVDGFPKTLTLLEMVRYFVDHRLEVTRRRSEFRKRRAEAQAHLLEGYLVALDAIDEVVRIIRGSRDTASARNKLMKQFKLSEIQTNAILEMPLRRLTNMEVTKIRADLAELRKQIAELTRLLTDDSAMRGLVSDELETVSLSHGTPRASVLMEEAPASAAATVSLEIPDEPCLVTLSTSGLIGRFGTEPFKGTRGKHDALTAALPTTARATIGAVTSRGRLLHVPVIELPTADAKVRGGAVTEFIGTEAGERVLTLVPLEGTMLALATRNGVVKRIAATEFGKRSGQEVIGLKGDDELVAAVPLPAEGADEADLIFVTSDAQLLRTSAGSVRPQGRTGGGVAGVKLAADAHVVGFGVAAAGADAATLVVTVTDGAGVKATPLADYPAKGRATGGVRCMRLLKGETVLVAAYVGATTPVAVAATGGLVKLPAEVGKRDAAGVRLETPLARLAVAR